MPFNLGDIGKALTDVGDKVKDGADVVVKAVGNGSKGIQCYTYIAIDGFALELSVPGGNPVRRDRTHEFTHDHLEVETNKIQKGLVGRFQCRILRNGQEIDNKWVDINAVDGMLTDGNMRTLDQQHCLLGDDYCVTYGFYDAPGEHNPLGLSPWNQFYITVTPNLSRWMSQLAPPGSDASRKPFNRMVLPGAHDVGMNSMDHAQTLLRHAGGIFLKLLLQSFKPDLAAAVKVAVPSPTDKPDLFSHVAGNIVQSLSITQKDDLRSILAMGVRYFEFRPAYLHQQIRTLNVLPNELYFTHLCIPGMTYTDFLNTTLDFLRKNPDEIVVCQVRWDGIMNGCDHPSDQDLADHRQRAVDAVQGEIQIGDINDMKNRTIEQIRNDKKRFISFTMARQYNVYSDEGNATINGDSIVKNYEGINEKDQMDNEFSVLQCQATATNIPASWALLPTTTSYNSLLLGTKAVCDSKTLPWLKANAEGKLVRDRLAILLDDFVDGALCDIARELSEKRLRN